MKRRDLFGETARSAAALFGAAIAAATPGAVAQPAAAPKVRRVIVANDPNGKSYIASDELLDRNEVWRTSGEEPLGKSPSGEPRARLPSTAPAVDPPPGGSRWAFASIGPWEDMRKRFEAGAIPGHDKGGFHRTSTIDYILVLDDGELTLLTERDEVKLHRGDMVVQRNTLHSWRNYGATPITILGVLIRLPQSA